MTKSLKIIAPMALVAFATLASCGGGKPTDKYKIDRLQLADTIDDKDVATKVPEILTGTMFSKNPDYKKLGFYGDQYEIETEEKGANATKVVDTYKMWKTQSKGSVTVQYGIALGGSVSALIKGFAPIDLENINIATSNQVKISWDVKDGSDIYLKAEDNNNKSYIVSKKSVDGVYSYYFCFDLKGVGKFGTVSHSMKEYGYAQNFITYYLPEMLGFFRTRGSFDVAASAYRAPMMGAGFDLSGFGLDLDCKFGGGYTDPIAVNYLAPGMLFGGMPLGDDSANEEEVPTIYYYLQKARGLLQEQTFNYVFKKEDSETHKKALTGDIYLKNYNLANVADLIKDTFKGTLELEGSANAEYFFAYENSFLRQQELSIDLSAPKIIVLAKAGSRSLGVVGSNVNLNLYLSEDVTDDCTRETVDVTEYITEE